MTHDSGHLVIGILLFAVAIAMLAATVSWFYVIGGAIMRLIAKPAASQAVAASRPAIVAAGRLRGLPCQPSSKAREQQACGQLTQSITATSGDP
jgi:uncharacterized iron-regulated membrane protein